MCGKELVVDNFMAGYGCDADGKPYCYDCCAQQEREFMLDNGKSMLYLVKKDHKYFVTDWLGHLSFHVACHWTRKHNWYGVTQEYVRFIGPDNKVWSGRNVGDNQIVRVKRTRIPVSQIMY
jgi:hypothetical protein